MIDTAKSGSETKYLETDILLHYLNKEYDKAKKLIAQLNYTEAQTLSRAVSMMSIHLQDARRLSR